MPETTKLELVTPVRMMAQQNVEMVVLPGVEGLFGVLPRHSPLLAGLARGVIEIYENGKVNKRFMIDGGLADVSSETVTILAERAIDLDAVDASKLKAQAEEATGVDSEFLSAAINNI